MESSLKDKTKASGSLLNHTKAEPLRVMEKALHLTGSWYPCSHQVLVGVKVVYGVFRSTESFDLRHSELCWKREV